MTLARYILAASVLLSPTLAHAQDFGVMESAETINKGNFKLKVIPMFILGTTTRSPRWLAASATASPRGSTSRRTSPATKT